MQVCTSLQTDNHASTPPLCFLQAGCLSCRPTNSVKALKALLCSVVPVGKFRRSGETTGSWGSFATPCGISTELVGSFGTMCNRLVPASSACQSRPYSKIYRVNHIISKIFWRIGGKALESNPIQRRAVYALPRSQAHNPTLTSLKPLASPPL